MMAPFGIDPVGFKYIKIFHLCFGVSYFGYYTNTNVKYITMGTTLLYLILQILANVPCFFHCTFDTKELFGKAGLSPNFMSFIIVYLDLYHVVMTCLIIMSRGGKIREFFNELHDYSRNFGVKLVTTQKNKLMATAVRLIFYNIVHIVGEVLMLTLLVEHKLARQPKSAVVNMMYVPSSGSNSTSKPEEDDESLIPLSYSFWYHLNLFLKLFSVVYSKVIETVLVYIATYLAMVLKRLESRFDKFIYTKAGGRSIEVAKVAFIEMQNLIKGADEVFSHTAFDPLFVNVLIVLIGLFVAIDGITRRRTLDHNDWHELYNAFSSFFAIYMCCTAGDEVEEELDQVIQSIAYINGEAFTEPDFRSYSLLVTISSNTTIRGLTAGRWFSLNKKLLFLIVFFTVIYTMLLLQSGMKGS